MLAEEESIDSSSVELVELGLEKLGQISSW